jgi:hypothetical protein
VNILIKQTGQKAGASLQGIFIETVRCKRVKEIAVMVEKRRCRQLTYKGTVLFDYFVSGSRAQYSTVYWLIGSVLRNWSFGRLLTD